MKPEFSEVLIPAKLHSSASTDSSIRYIGREKGSMMSKCLLTLAIVFAFVVAILMTAFIVRYEDKFSAQELRIQSLEKELSSIYEMWEEEYGPLHVSEKDFEYEIPTHDDILFASDENAEEDYGSKEEEDDHRRIMMPEEEEEDKHFFGDVKVDDENETQSRRKRQVPIQELPTFGPGVERTADGVPILEKSYLDRTERPLPLPAYFARYEQPTTTDSEGLRLYEGLQATGGRNEPRSLNTARHFGQNGILPHHRTSASWTQREERRAGAGSGIQLKSGDSQSNSQEGQNYRRTSAGRRSSSTLPLSHRQTSTILAAEGAPATYHRSSRVPATEDFLIPPPSPANTRSIQHAPLQRFGQGDGEVIARVLQTDDSDFAHPPHIPTESEGRRRQGSRRVTPKRQAPLKSSRKISDYSGDINIVKAEAWVEGPGKAIAAHWVADVSNYTTSQRNYEGNGRLRNVDGIFSAWKPSKWMETSTTDEEKNFVMNQYGVVTVKKPGLYVVYAQVTYLDDHDINGYIIQVDQDIFLQCTANTPAHNGRTQTNSCYTSGIRHLDQDARLIVKDIEVNRYSIFRPEKTFFGLYRIGDA